MPHDSYSSERFPVTVRVAIIGLILNSLVTLAGWIWAAGRMSFSLDSIKTQQQVLIKFNEQQNIVIQSMITQMAVIQAEHNKLVMPHVMNNEK